MPFAHKIHHTQWNTIKELPEYNAHRIAHSTLAVREILVWCKLLSYDIVCQFVTVGVL